jgi:hypothetical protein
MARAYFFPRPACLSSILNFLHPGSGEIVHPARIDGNRKGADGGVYSTRLHDEYSPVFYYLVTVVPLLS